MSKTNPRMLKNIRGFLFYWYEIPGQAGDDILLHAELVDAAVGVGLTWTEEC